MESKVDAELITKLIVALVILVLCWFYFSSDRTQRKLLVDKQKLTDRNLGELSTEVKALRKERDALLANVTEYRAEISEVQEHCARLRKGQQRMASRLKYVCGMVDGISGQRRAQGPIEVSFIEREPAKAKIPPRVKAKVKDLGNQLRNF